MPSCDAEGSAHWPTVTAVSRLSSALGRRWAAARALFDTAGKFYLGEQMLQKIRQRTLWLQSRLEMRPWICRWSGRPRRQCAGSNACAPRGRESEGRSLASEVLHLYREVHLIEQLSEQLAALLNLTSVSQSALAQAQRLIRATSGCILVMGEGTTARFCNAQLRSGHSCGGTADDRATAVQARVLLLQSWNEESRKS